MRTDVVVARFYEPLTWVKKLDKNFNPVIYNKGADVAVPENATCVSLPNIGREEFVYFKYIVDHYDTLPDRVVFTQANPFFHSPKFLSLLQHVADFAPVQPLTCGWHIAATSKYIRSGIAQLFKFKQYPIALMFIDDTLGYVTPATAKQHRPHPSKWIIYRAATRVFDKQVVTFRKDASELLRLPFRDYYGQPITPVNFGAIFSVSRDMLRQHPREYYEYLLQLSEHFHATRHMPGNCGFPHVMEMCWLELFRYDPPKELAAPVQV